MQGNPAANNIKWGMRVLGVAMVPMTASLPQGVFVYWITSNVVSCAQTLGAWPPLRTARPQHLTPSLRSIEIVHDTLADGNPSGAAASGEPWGGRSAAEPAARTAAPKQAPKAGFQRLVNTESVSPLLSHALSHRLGWTSGRRGRGAVW